jgi:hypothetical protein
MVKAQNTGNLAFAMAMRPALIPVQALARKLAEMQ